MSVTRVGPERLGTGCTIIRWHLGAAARGGIGRDQGGPMRAWRWLHVTSPGGALGRQWQIARVRVETKPSKVDSVPAAAAAAATAHLGRSGPAPLPLLLPPIATMTAESRSV